MKITNVAYKMLEFFPEADPLKNRAKEKILTVMENLALFFNKSEWRQLSDCFMENREKRAEKLLEDIEIILNFFQLGRLQGWIGDANFLIISNEYEKISKDILFNLPQRKLFDTEVLKIENKAVEIQKQIVGNNLMMIETKEIKHDLPVSKNKHTEEKTGFLEKPVSGRQKKILEFLVENKKAQVMDLQIVLADVTKRTIRRDLDDLLEKGRVVRIGKFNQVFYELGE